MGEVFAGRYELVDVLAAGGVGTVWRTWDHRDRTYRAAKVLRQSDSDSLLRFVRETSRRIDHPHVIAPHSWAGEDERILFTMPLVRGGSIAALLSDFGALPLGWAIELFRQSLRALVEVHDVGLVHRDVKPANLLLEATGSGHPHLRISDFGAALQVGAPRLTHTDTVIGTPGYLSPEQGRGADPAPTQDIYAVGVLGLQLLTGLPPSPDGVLPVAPRVDVTSAALADLLARMTVDDPGGRPQSARQVLGALDAIPGTDDLLRGTDPANPVEIFDHVPPLPDGWNEQGPTAARSAPAEPATTPLRRRDPAAVRPAESRLIVPRAAWVLGVIGVVLIVVAVIVW